MQGSHDEHKGVSALLFALLFTHTSSFFHTPRALQAPTNSVSLAQGCKLALGVQDRKEKDSFFNWFYFAINLGSFLAVTTLVYVQESVSWTIGFAIPAAAMLLAVVTFVAGSSKYVHVEPTERYVHMSNKPCQLLFLSSRQEWLSFFVHTMPTERHVPGLTWLCSELAHTKRIGTILLSLMVMIHRLQPFINFVAFKKKSRRTICHNHSAPCQP